MVVSWIRNNSSCTKKGVDLIKISFTYLGTSNSKFRLNLTQRVTGSLVIIYKYKLRDMCWNTNQQRYSVLIQISPLVLSVHYKGGLTKILIMEVIIKKNPWASRLWVGRRKDLFKAILRKTTKKRLHAV